MTKKIALIVAAVTIIFAFFKLDFFSHTPILGVSNYIKIKFEQVRQSIANFSQRHFHQASLIETLKEENERLKKEAVTLDAFAKEVINLSRLKKYSNKMAPEVLTVRAVSYASLPDFNKIWIDFSDFNTSKIYGLIYNNVAAGIVIKSNGLQSLALLNGDSKCSYAVYVGKKEYPGVAIGKRRNLMVVRYIPSWADVKVGDEVFTSGLDGIFFEGLKVGKVTKVRNLNLYKEVEMTPFYDSLKPDYFYLVLKTK